MKKTPVGVFYITFNLHLAPTCLKGNQFYIVYYILVI